MIKIVFVFISGIIIIIFACLAFYLNVGKNLPLSSSGQNWAVFGNYFGGVAGSLLSFLSVLLIVYTINQQEKQIKTAQQESLKIDLLKYLSKADEEIERWLQRKLAASQSDREVEFGDIVWGIVNSDYANQEEFASAVIRLHKLTCSYCTSISTYQDNINTYFIVGHHRRKAEDLLVFLENHQDKLNQMAGPSLALCRMGLNGQTNE